MNFLAYIVGCLLAVWAVFFFGQWMPKDWLHQWWTLPAGVTIAFCVLGFGTLCGFLWDEFISGY